MKKKAHIDTDPNSLGYKPKNTSKKWAAPPRAFHASEAASRVPGRADGSCAAASPELPAASVGIWNACVICM